MVNSDLCLHLSPNLSINMGTTANTKLNAAKQLKPHPYPSRSANGAVASGKNVPTRHLVTITPVMADAEYMPQASTTYALNGTTVNSNVKPMSATEASSKRTGSRYSAIHPYPATEKGSKMPPRMESGSRYSGFPVPEGLRRRRWT